MRPRLCAILAFSVLGLLVLGRRPAAAEQLQALVPAYFYPVGNPYWSELDAAAGQIGVTAILNPNGPHRNLTNRPKKFPARQAGSRGKVSQLRASPFRVASFVPDPT